MPRPCPICVHAERATIEADITTSEVTGNPSLRSIADKYGFNKDLIARHRTHKKDQSQIRQAINIFREKTEIKIGSARSLLDQVEETRKITEEILNNTRNGEFFTDIDAMKAEIALKAIDRRQKQIEIQARLTGAFQKEKDNQADIERKKIYYPRMIERLLKKATDKGIVTTREEIINSIAAYPDHGDIYDFVTTEPGTNTVNH